MAELASLTVGRQLHAGDEPVALSEPEGQRAPLDFQDLAVDLREKGQDLVDEDTERRRRRLGRRAGDGEDQH